MTNDWEDEFEIDENEPETYTELFNKWFFKVNWIDKEEDK